MKVLPLRKRYQLVLERERAELRRAAPRAKLAQTASLMASVEAMGWSEELKEGDTEVWARWQTLRRRLGAAS